MNSRLIANKIINKVIEDRCPLNDAFSEIIPSTASCEMSFIKECCFGVLRWYDQLCCIESALLNFPLKNKDRDIDRLILLGLYQIIYTHVPDHAAVSETVSVCKAIKKDWATGLVNKCLRRFLNEKQTILSSLKNDERYSFSHPKWLSEKIKTAWPKQWQNILNANNEKPPLWLRINTQKTSQKQYLNTLEENNIAALSSSSVSSAVLIKTPVSVDDIPQFKEGYVSVQDIAGQFAANFLDLKKGQRVLDACAAPGSKTSHILELQPGVEKLVIVDKDARRFPMVKENILRLGLNHQNTQLILADAIHTKQWWNGSLFDRILLDAPCSSTGVIRRHPDIKLLKQSHDIDFTSQVQKQLLIALWKLLKKNGKLLYSTCSILPEENEQVISSFLAHCDDAKTEKIDIPFGISNRYGTQLFPETNGPDGFYYALLVKK